MIGTFHPQRKDKQMLVRGVRRSLEDALQVALRWNIEPVTRTDLPNMFESPEELKQFHAEFNGFIGHLTRGGFGRQVFKIASGFEGGRPHTYGEIAQELGMTENDARAYHIATVTWIRQYM